ncbi:MAG TPA: 6-bladed beta-propeller [Longimicrobiaceae bacterium]|nr:6-bladed beta-propeller [Longimicrobiaceae bacterium]
MRRSLHRAGAALLAAALAAGHAGAQVVRLPDRDRALAGTPAPAFSIGAEEGESWEMLSNVRAVAFDRSDNLYLLDSGNQRVLVFDRTGRFVRQIGKQGEGPGELMYPSGLGLAADGTVVVADAGRRAWSLFSPAGAFLRNVGFSEEWMPMVLGGAVRTHPQGLVTAMRPSPLRALQEGRQVQSSSVTPLMLVPLREGSAPRKVFDVPQHTETRQTSSSTPGGERQVRIMIPGPPVFSPEILYGVLPDGNLALSFTKGYTIRIVDVNGTTSRYLQRALRPRPVTEEDRERERRRREEMQRTGRGMTIIQQGGPGGGRGGGAPPRIDLPPPEFADTMPVVRGMVVSPSGKIWVGRTGRWWDDDGPIDLITPTGEYLGTLTGQTLPAAISPGGLAAWIERDDLDVERVVVRRLPAAWR